MPIVKTGYKVPNYFKNSHVHTLYPYFMRKVSGVDYKRERIKTSDGDFLDLDWSLVGSQRLVVLSHGLEGSTGQTYILGMVKVLNEAGYDCLAWNNRSCSGEMNLLPSFYHSGMTCDLKEVIGTAVAKESYSKIALVGFSMGANQTLKYLGEEKNIPDEVQAAVTFSCPLDLGSCAVKLKQFQNILYLSNFMFTIKKKLMQKHLKRPYENVDVKKAMLATNFLQWDEVVTAPLHGFKSGSDYHERASSLPFLKNIRIPTLLVNSKDDPFLTPESFPTMLAKDHDFFHLETPKHGGHVAFMSDDFKLAWSEMRTLKFLESLEF